MGNEERFSIFVNIKQSGVNLGWLFMFREEENEDSTKRKKEICSFCFFGTYFNRNIDDYICKIFCLSLIQY